MCRNEEPTRFNGEVLGFKEWFAVFLTFQPVELSGHADLQQYIEQRALSVGGASKTIARVLFQQDVKSDSSQFERFSERIGHEILHLSSVGASMAMGGRTRRPISSRPNRRRKEC